MSTQKTPLDLAQELLAMDPLPADAEKQLDKLAKKAGRKYANEFGCLYEALFVRQNEKAPDQ